MAKMGEIRAYRGTPYDSQKHIKLKQFIQEAKISENT